MSKFPDVRIATPADRDGVLALARMLHSENGMFPLDEGSMIDVVDRSIAPSRHGVRDGIMGVIGEEGRPLRSCICIVVHNLWYTKQVCADELFNFVHPNYRRSDYGKQMVEFAKASADAWDLPLVIGVLSTNRTKAKVEMYRRMLPEAGAYFVYKPKKAG